MATTNIASQMPLSERVEGFIIANIREEHPYMNMEAVCKAAKAGVRVMMRKVQEQGEAGMRDTKELSDFLRLSPELRNRIYNLTLRPLRDGDGGIKGCRAICVSLFCEINGNSCSISDYRTTAWAEQPAITRVCRQIRSETLPMYYGSNNFVMESLAFWDCSNRTWQCNFKGAESWLSQIGPENAALIRRLDVCYDTSWWDHDSSKTSKRKALAEDLEQ